MRSYYRRAGSLAPTGEGRISEEDYLDHSFRGFLICIIIVGILIAGAFVWNYVVAPAVDSADQSSAEEIDYSDQEWSDPTISWYQGSTDFTVTLNGEESEVLTFQEIYQKNISSICNFYVTDGLSTYSATGIVLTEDGYLLTNAHVVNGMSSAQVALPDGEVLDALMVGYDRFSDLAVLKAEPEQALTPAEFGDSALLEVGDTALALGNPTGPQLWGSLTNGIISAVDREVDMGGYTMTLLQTTAAIDNGSSGGMLLNNHGQVIGVTNMKFTDTTMPLEGLGFAIPSTTVKQVVDSLIRYGSYHGTPTIGIYGKASDIEDLPGVVVVLVNSGSPAEDAGLRENDVITAVDGTAVSSVEEIHTITYEKETGSTITLTVYRPDTGETFDVEIVLEGSYHVNGWE